MKKIVLLLLMLPLLVAFSLPTPVMAKTKWDLEGWRYDQGKWMDGLLWAYYECSWVPYRLAVTGYDGTDNISIQHDYLDGKGNFGFDDAQNFFIGPQTVREQSPYPIGNIPIMVDEFAGIFHIEGPNPVGVSNGKIIEYNIIIDDPALLTAAAGVDFAIYWEAHCSKSETMGGVGEWIEFGSSYWNGASLHTHTSVTGNQDVPIKTPPEFGPPIDVEKYVSDDGCNWYDADSSPGLSLGCWVWFRFVITNNSDDVLTNVTLSDSELPVSVPPDTTLEPGVPYVVELGPICTDDIQHTYNTATATGDYGRQTFTDNDNAYYYYCQ